MAVVTSHTLDSLDGTHAGGIHVTLIRLGAVESTLFTTQMDKGGRLSETVDPAKCPSDATYQLLFDTGLYWQERLDPSVPTGFINQIALRFHMPDPDGQYHLPVILSPHGYSMWMSGSLTAQV